MEAPEKVDYSQLNPQITDVEIGVRNLRKITIYPLSMADQLETTDMITATIQAFFAKEDINNDVVFVKFLVELIKDNLGKVLSMVTDEDGDQLLKDMTNMQGASVAEIVFDVNYGDVAKNAEGLVEKIRKIFPSARQSPQLSNIMQGIDSRTSIEDPSRTGESPSPNSESSIKDIKAEKSQNSN